ncbi:LLM class flavin-dependent oxidoreductase [Sorangium sp. So ce124]
MTLIVGERRGDHLDGAIRWLERSRDLAQRSYGCASFGQPSVREASGRGGVQYERIRLVAVDFYPVRDFWLRAIQPGSGRRNLGRVAATWVGSPQPGSGRRNLGRVARRQPGSGRPPATWVGSPAATWVRPPGRRWSANPGRVAIRASVEASAIVDTPHDGEMLGVAARAARGSTVVARTLKLGAFMRPVSIHTGAWRYPGAYPDANFNFAHLKRFAQRLEQARFDAFFMADHLAVLNMPLNALVRSHTVTSFEPFTLLSALAGATEHIGLVATASTTFDQPFHVARRFASLDHLSGGRAGWNIVTTANPDAALNFGLTEHVEHDERYRRAREFFDVVTGLWDSFADDALVRDVEAGIYFDAARLHVLDHRGKHYSVRGPLNIARPVQGWPVIVQAGASEAGRQLAAETAEVVFAAQSTLEGARRFYADVKGRLERLGRHPDTLKILPGALVVVGDTVQEAQEKRARLDSLVHFDSSIASLSIALGCDASRFDPDAPLPEIPPTNAGQSGRERAIELARREGLTVRQLAQRLGGFGGLAFVGTPGTIADQMEEWLIQNGCDGFNIMFPYLPGGLDDFVDRVVPELQRRGLFRREYEGRTLRENLGLARPPNRFFPTPAAAR